MSQESERRSKRIVLSTRARVRGLCGEFDAMVQDISLSGVRVRLARVGLHIAEDADLATAAATVQTRIGSRCVLELGLRQLIGPLSKTAALVRLVLPSSNSESLDLGCRFDEPLTDAECAGLRLDLPTDEPARHVRNELTWEDERRPRLDPTLTEEKVDALFGVETGPTRDDGERAPDRPLRVILCSSADGRAAAPLVARAESFTVATILVRVGGDTATEWLSGRRDLAEVAQAVKRDYGNWPELEVADGARRLWRGGARVCGLEVGQASEQDVFLRLAFGRRLRAKELERICKAA